MRLATITVALCVIGLVPVAHAGGTGTSESSGGSSETGASSSESTSTDASSSETTGTETSGATTGTDDSTTGSTTDDSGTDTTGVADDTTTAPSTEEGGCDACPTSDESLAFDEPANEATVDAPFTVTVEAVPRCPCFACDCPAEDPEYVQLFVDTLAWAGPCFESPCTWEVTTEVGSHTLTASATYPGGEATQSIVVHVASVDPGTSTGMEPDPTTATPDTADTTSGAAVGEPAPEGCGCTTPPRAPTRAPNGWAFTLVLLGLRRRAR